MGNPYFKFKQFTVYQKNTAMKVGVDGVLLGAWVNAESAKSILDIGTGTGLLSLMLAQKSNAAITAIEIDEKAFKQALENVKKSKWSDRITVKLNSIQKYTNTNRGNFDLIICNPPYFTKSLNSVNEQRNLARHDNSLPISNLMSCVKKLLSIEGSFFMIYPYDKKDMVFKEAEQYHLFPCRVLIIKGTEQKTPIRFAVQFSFEKVACSTNKLIVRDPNNNGYTPDYKKLTEDYYLAF